MSPSTHENVRHQSFGENVTFRKKQEASLPAEHMRADQSA
jgi:hypothetical protein